MIYGSISLSEYRDVIQFKASNGVRPFWAGGRFLIVNTAVESFRRGLTR